jgi:23S rRNA A2030 N6-methylase RlmJ
MANKHFGNIGDIWKHLPLAEILAIEGPRAYWESHAGSARYALTHCHERDYGIFGFLKRASRSELLSSCRFRLLLDELKSGGASLGVYPGSPLIAMMVLGDGPSYLFCDLDGDSLATVGERARSLEITAGRLRCVQDDGAATLLEGLGRMPGDDAGQTLIFIDPFEIEPSSLALFSRAAALGTKVLLWYSFDSSAEQESLRQLVGSSVTHHGAEGAVSRLWFGEVHLRDLDRPDPGFNPGVRGCGIVCANLSDRAVQASAGLGRELARAYEGASLPSGGSGALDFRSLPGKVPAWQPDK